MSREINGSPIVVGLDRGEHEAVVLAAAMTQARSVGSALRVVHAIAPRPPSDRVDDADSRRRARHEAEGALRTLVDALTGGVDEPKVEYLVRHGDPATVLLDAARDAGLIVVGTHGAGHHAPFLLGVVSQDVAVHTRCPVLLVPPP